MPLFPTGVMNFYSADKKDDHTIAEYVTRKTLLDEKLKIAESKVLATNVPLHHLRAEHETLLRQKKELEGRAEKTKEKIHVAIFQLEALLSSEEYKEYVRNKKGQLRLSSADDMALFDSLTARYQRLFDFLQGRSAFLEPEDTETKEDTAQHSSSPSPQDESSDEEFKGSKGPLKALVKVRNDLHFSKKFPMRQQGGNKQPGFKQDINFFKERFADGKNSKANEVLTILTRREERHRELTKLIQKQTELIDAKLKETLDHEKRLKSKIRKGISFDNLGAPFLQRREIQSDKKEEEKTAVKPLTPRSNYFENESDALLDLWLTIIRRATRQEQIARTEGAHDLHDVLYPLCSIKSKSDKEIAQTLFVKWVTDHSNAESVEFVKDFDEFKTMLSIANRTQHYAYNPSQKNNALFCKAFFKFFYMAKPFMQSIKVLYRIDHLDDALRTLLFTLIEKSNVARGFSSDPSNIMKSLIVEFETILTEDAVKHAGPYLMHADLEQKNLLHFKKMSEDNTRITGLDQAFQRVLEGAKGKHIEIFLSDQERKNAAKHAIKQSVFRVALHPRIAKHVGKEIHIKGEPSSVLQKSETLEKIALVNKCIDNILHNSATGDKLVFIAQLCRNMRGPTALEQSNLVQLLSPSEKKAFSDQLQGRSLDQFQKIQLAEEVYVLAHTKEVSLYVEQLCDLLKKINIILARDVLEVTVNEILQETNFSSFMLAPQESKKFSVSTFMDSSLSHGRSSSTSSFYSDSSVSRSRPRSNLSVLQPLEPDNSGHPSFSKRLSTSRLFSSMQNLSSASTPAQHDSAQPSLFPPRPSSRSSEVT